MLVVSRGSQSIDPRDRVYALLGLLPALCTSELQLLYGQSPEDTWIRTISLILRKSKNLFLFSQIGLTGYQAERPRGSPQSESQNASSSMIPHDPSWAPDWVRDRSLTGTQSIPADTDLRIAREGLFGRYIEERGLQIEILPDHILQLSGVAIDTVEEASFYTFSVLGISNIAFIVAQIMIVLSTKWARANNQELDYESLHSSILRILIGDCVPVPGFPSSFRVASMSDIEKSYSRLPSAASASEAEIVNLDPLTLDHMVMNLRGKIITREKAYLALTLAVPQAGGVGFILNGFTHPMLLRPFSDTSGAPRQKWRVVGECFIAFHYGFDGAPKDWHDIYL